MASFGQMLETARRSRELTLRELGKLVQMTPSSLSEMEHGRRMPPKEKLKILQLAHVLKVPKDKLYLAAQEARNLKKGIMEKKLTQMDPEMAVGFYRAIETVPEERFKEELRKFIASITQE